MSESQCESLGPIEKLTLKEKLLKRKERLNRELKETCQAITYCEQNPNLEEKYKAILKADRY